MNYRKIEDLLKSHNIDVITFCNEIGMSKGGYYQMLKAETLKVDVLERIARFFNVPVSTFFNEPELERPADYQKKYIQALEQNSRLQEELSKLKDEIRVLEKNSPLRQDTPIRKLE